MDLYKQTTTNEIGKSRDAWVAVQLEESFKQFSGPRLLDVGAGNSPYRDKAVEIGFTYLSHDFSQYLPSDTYPGMQNKEWAYQKHDFVCDILELPLVQCYEVVLITEVLEHVPDPIRAIEHLSRLVVPNGYVIATVPFLSLMHQAPYWFQSGLSPFWFHYWFPKNTLTIKRIEVCGDYFDLMVQENQRLLFFIKNKYFKGFLRWAVRFSSRFHGKATLSSGGLGVFVVAQKLI